MNNQLQQNAAEIGKLVRQMALTVAPLQADLHFADNQLAREKGSQFWRRTVIRCLLAVIESVLWNMKHVTPKAAAISHVPLTNDELEVLNEERTVTANGKIERRRKFLPFRENVKVCFSLFGKVHGVTVVFTGCHGFEAFCATYEIRSRLMHPKKPFNPEVSDKDIATALQGMGWFMSEYQLLLQKCGRERFGGCSRVSRVVTGRVTGGA
jgi:hypothetical protein